MRDPAEPSVFGWQGSPWRALALIALLVAGALWLLRSPPSHHPSPTIGRPPAAPTIVTARARPAPIGPKALPPLTHATPFIPAARALSCTPAPQFAQAAVRNAQSLQSLAWAPFRRAEVGWEIYAPLIAHEIGSACSPGDTGFAARLAQWQRAHAIAPDGVVGAPTFQAMVLTWHRRRPFVAATAHGACPPAPDAASLAPAHVDEGYSGKAVSLRTAALDAYRRMVQAARAEVPGLEADPRLLTIFSGFRSPADDDARCAREQNCQGLVRAACSAHRTGLAVDLYLGSAPGARPEFSDDANRLYQSRSPAYRWLVVNAERFGFVNYPFEPWHWEWTGEAP